MATTLASWEDRGGAAFCSITAVSSLCLCLSKKKATAKVLGKGERLGTKPSTVLSPPFPLKRERFERLGEALQEISIYWIPGR